MCAQKWDNGKLQDFINCFSNDQRLQQVSDLLDTLQQNHTNGELINVDNMNSVVDTLGQIFDESAKQVFGVSHNKLKNNRSTTSSHHYTPWFDNNCKVKRKRFHKARKVYNLHKNVVNRTTLNASSREYKQELNLAFQRYQEKISKEIRQASASNPKKFWDIINRCTNKKNLLLIYLCKNFMIILKN